MGHTRRLIVALLAAYDGPDDLYHSLPARSPQSTMNSPTQPILCCLGDNVGADPTQYLMERGFEALGLDWRAITAEVSPQDWTGAIQGAKALGFRGLRFLGQVPVEAKQALGCSPDTPISSAIRTSVGWQCWHNAAFAVQEFAESRFGDSRKLRFEIIDETPHWRSIAGYLTSEQEIAEDELLVRAEVETISTNEGQVDLHAVASAQTDESPKLEPEPEPQDVDEPDNNAAPSPVTCFVGGTSDSVLLTIARLREQDNESPSLWLPDPAESAKSLEAIKHHDVEHCIVVTPQDLLAHGDAFDFHMWTGRRLDLSLAHEAYDEFHAF